MCKKYEYIENEFQMISISIFQIVWNEKFMTCMSSYYEMGLLVRITKDIYLWFGYRQNLSKW